MSVSLKPFFKSLFSFKSLSVFLILLSIVGFISINKGFTGSFENPYGSNIDRIAIEKEFNCSGKSCIDVMPFESKSLLGIYDGESKYKGKNKDYYLIKLNAPLKPEKFFYSFFKSIEDYFYFELVQSIWFFTFLLLFIRKYIK